MGREMLARDLEQAENHVRHGASLLRNQKLILLELEADGHDTRRAHELLDTFQTLELEHIAHRDRLEEELDEAEKENGTRAGPMAKDVAKALGKSI